MKRPSGPDPRRPVAKPTNGWPVRWEPFLDSLKGFGLLNSQMNEHRLYVPVELRRRLGNLLEIPWVISYWCEGCLRVVPEHLWQDYLEQVCAQLHEIRLQGWVEEAIVQPAATITLEQGGRWNLPPALTALSRIGGGALCVLCPSEGGIEIWEANAKHRRLRAITEEILQRRSLSPPAGSGAPPRVNGDPPGGPGAARPPAATDKPPGPPINARPAGDRPTPPLPPPPKEPPGAPPS